MADSSAPGTPRSPGDTLAERVAALERAVQRLQKELSRVSLQISEAPPAPAAPLAEIEEPLPLPAIVVQPASPRRALPDLETLVGRYGMPAIAALLALAAVGTFLAWAIAHGLLGPSMRVFLGLAVAGALAVWGVRLRRREPSFGGSVLGLALAVVHLCAWAAGPSLGLVPAPASLALSAAASVGLAAFALVEGDEPLWCAGFAGACAAPFVTSTGHGTAPMLAGYAAAVLVASGSALGSRPWIIAARLFAAGAALFTAALWAMPARQHAQEIAVALPFVVAAFGVFPFAHGTVLRPRLRTLGILGAASTLVLADRTTAASPPLAAAAVVLLAGLAWLVAVDRSDTEPPGTLVDGWGSWRPATVEWVDGLLPLAYLFSAADFALGHPARMAAVFGLAALLLVFMAARRIEGALRDALACSTWVSANVAILAATDGSAILLAPSVAWGAVLLLLVGRTVPSRTWRWATLLSLAGASLWILALLTARPSYEYTPLCTQQSAAALAVALAWIAAAIASRQPAERGARWAPPCAFAFLWIHQEIAWAVSPTVAKLLLVTYYAAISVACVGVGRAKGSPPVRHLGLGLGLLAAGVALHGAWSLSSTAARIAACAVVSGFLLGIAWWYRQPGPRGAARSGAVSPRTG